MDKRVAIYARVSTADQTVENQLKGLREVAERHGWQIVREFVDQGVSGAKGRDGRPQFEALHKAIARKEIDLVMVWSVDRLGRSLKDLVAFLGELHEKGVGLFLHQQGIDTTTPAGKALFSMLGVFAEFERSIIVERVRAGMSRAKAQGKHCGRPRISLAVEAQILTLRKEQRMGMRAIARRLSVGNCTVQRVLSSQNTLLKRNSVHGTNGFTEAQTVV